MTDRLRSLHQGLKELWESEVTTVSSPEHAYILAMASAMALDVILTELTKDHD